VDLFLELIDKMIENQEKSKKNAKMFAQFKKK
jgi:hypothetical protein